MAVIAMSGLEVMSKPHIGFILVDDLGYNDAAWDSGSPSTDLKDAWPSTRKYAAEGVVMTHYYTQPICTPSRGAFMSGRYPIRLGLQSGVINPGIPTGLPLEETTLPQKLQGAGYRTLGVGKWHLGAHSLGSLPTERGFDEWYGYSYGWGDYWNHTVGTSGPGICNPGYCFLDLGNGTHLDTSRSGTYATFLFSDKVNEMLERHYTDYNDKPFFLYYAMQNVHSPLESPDQWLLEEPCVNISNDNRKIFCAQARMADAAFSNFSESVRRLFPSDDVVYIVSGDNGGNPRGGGNNMPLRGRKGQLWEGGVRNNAFIWSNSSSILPETQRGTRYESLMHITDWHATILDLASAGLDGNLDGKSHLRAIQYGTEGPRTELLHNIDPFSGGPTPEKPGNFSEAAYRMGDMKLLLNVRPGHHYELPKGEQNSVQEGQHRSNHLFNITEDETEDTDLYARAEYSEIIKTMTEKIEALQKEMIYSCHCAPYCPSGVKDCPFDDESILKAEEVGGWVPWLPGSKIVEV